MPGRVSGVEPSGLRKLKEVDNLALRERDTLIPEDLEFINPSIAGFIRTLVRKYGAALVKLDKSGLPLVLQDSLLQALSSYWRLLSKRSSKFSGCFSLCLKYLLT